MQCTGITQAGGRCARTTASPTKRCHDHQKGALTRSCANVNTPSRVVSASEPVRPRKYVILRPIKNKNVYKYATETVDKILDFLGIQGCKIDSSYYPHVVVYECIKKKDVFDVVRFVMYADDQHQAAADVDVDRMLSYGVKIDYVITGSKKGLKRSQVI
jgi:hypothetical protein